MDSPEQIPLDEAVARGLIPCSLCGAKGADVRKVGERNHFLCARCARRGRAWTWVLAGFAIVIVGLGGYLLSRGRKPDVPRPGGAREEDPQRWIKETRRLIDAKRYTEARARIQELLEPLPKQPELNSLLGECLMGLKAYEAAIPPLRIAFDAGPPHSDQAGVYLGLALKEIGHFAEALKYLELPSKIDKDPFRAEAYIELGRFEEALKLLPDDSRALWARHRALLYMGRSDEARALAAKEPFVLVGQLREEGDFAGAAKILEANPGPRARKAELILAIESGDLAKVHALAAEISSDDAPFFRAIGQLMAGNRDAAKTGAWEFLAKTDKEYSPLRLERMMMRFLVGELQEADLEAESKLLSGSYANDLLWFLALATGKRDWAERALAVTPGHNYPYHSIQRILKK